MKLAAALPTWAKKPPGPNLLLQFYLIFAAGSNTVGAFAVFRGTKRRNAMNALVIIADLETAAVQRKNIFIWVQEGNAGRKMEPPLQRAGQAGRSRSEIICQGSSAANFRGLTATE